MLEGVWAVTAGERDGEPADVLKDVQFRGVRFVIAGDRITIRAPGREQAAALELEPGRCPKRLDITYGSGPGRRWFPGIYEVDGDTLTVCLGTDSRGRPAEFVTRPGAHAILFVLRRERPVPG